MAPRESAEALAARIVTFALNAARDPSYAATHAGEAVAVAASAALLVIMEPKIAKLPAVEGAKMIHSLGGKHRVGQHLNVSESTIVGKMGPPVRDMYQQLLRDDPKQARAFLIQEMMASLKLMSEILSNVSKTRSEISMTFARNARG